MEDNNKAHHIRKRTQHKSTHIVSEPLLLQPSQTLTQQQSEVSQDERE